jgi:hypothetical protein
MERILPYWLWPHYSPSAPSIRVHSSIRCWIGSRESRAEVPDLIVPAGGRAGQRPSGMRAEEERFLRVLHQDPHIRRPFLNAVDWVVIRRDGW